MIRFVGNDAEGFPLKRTQSQKACQSCRKRKKRCPHQASDSMSGTIPTPNSATSDLPPASRSNTEGVLSGLPFTDLTEQQPMRPLSRPSTNAGRHVSQLSSSAIADVRQSVAESSGGASAEHGDDDADPRFVGELNPEGTFVAAISPAGTTTAATASSPEDVVGVWVPRKLLDAAKSLPSPVLSLLLPYLEDECSRALPTSVHYEALYKLYIDDVHPLLPIINLESLQKHPERQRMILKLAVCLCVATNSKAKPHLRSPPNEFIAQTTQLLRSVIDNNLVQDRQIMTQLFVILSLSTQLSDDRHASAEFASRAVTCAQTSGLHLDTSASPHNHAYLTRLFFCVFALDRLNAAVHGRPVLIHTRDIGRDVERCIEQQSGLFQLLLRIVLVLDNIIALYRPVKNIENAAVDQRRDLDSNFPTFEDLLSSCGTIRVSAALVATAETLYHAVAMLSCRPQFLREESRSSLPHTRQTLSSASVISIVGTEFRGQLSSLPFVPYAMSLALRVSYRDLRLSKSSFIRTRARRLLLHVCSLLREFGNNFTSSMQMVELAEQTVREMDKAYSTVAGHRRTSVAAAAAIEPRSDMTHDIRGDEQGHSGHSETATYVETVHATSDGDPQAFDTTQFDFDLDIFDYFDPNFDISAIDAAFADPHNPSLPMDVGHFDQAGLWKTG